MKGVKKIVLLAFLIVLLTILLAVPRPVQSGLMPGWSMEYGGKPACVCPIPWMWNCLCMMME